MGGSWWRKWWWVVCFCFAAASVYLHFIQSKKVQVAELSSRFEEMRQEKGLALQERESLRLQIDSQSDPNWIEMVLMRDLGVVPEGWVKVHFTKEPIANCPDPEKSIILSQSAGAGQFATASKE